MLIGACNPMLCTYSGRETELATEQSAVNEGMRWVLALQQAAHSTSRSASQTSLPKTPVLMPTRKAPVPPSPFRPDFSGVLPAPSAAIGIPKSSGPAAAAAAASSSANAAAAAASPDRRRGGDEELDGQVRWHGLDLSARPSRGVVGSESRGCGICFKASFDVRHLSTRYCKRDATQCLQKGIGTGLGNGVLRQLFSFKASLMRCGFLIAS